MMQAYCPNAKRAGAGRPQGLTDWPCLVQIASPRSVGSKVTGTGAMTPAIDHRPLDICTHTCLHIYIHLCPHT